jgi:hypothetical protein
MIDFFLMLKINIKEDNNVKHDSRFLHALKGDLTNIIKY